MKSRKPIKLRTYCAMDIHHSHTVIEAQTATGVVLLHRDVPTEARYLIEALKSLPGPKGLTFEEGPMADWVMRVTEHCVEETIICNPYKNRLICDADADKSDNIDTNNLNTLYRMGQLQAVHHPEHQSMMDARRWVWLYLDVVDLTTAAKNKIKAAYRELGVQYGENDVYGKENRLEFLAKTPRRRLSRKRMEMLYANLDHLVDRVNDIRQDLYRMARRHPVAKRFLAIPGYGPVRAMTYLVIVDTPYRFVTQQKLWRYGGLGLLPKQSGRPEDIKFQRPRRYNRRLKAVAKGAMELALVKPEGNAFQQVYEHLVQRGLCDSLARLTAARKMLSVPWAMWKSNSEYDPCLVGKY